MSYIPQIRKIKSDNVKEETKEKNQIGKIIGACLVSVAGIQRGIGCTHIALSISDYLSRLPGRYRVAYVELSGQDHIQSMKFKNEIAETENSFKYKNIDFYYDTRIEELQKFHYDYIVADLGMVKDEGGSENENYKYLTGSTMPILVSGIKPWYYKTLEKTLLDKQNKTEDSEYFVLLMNFADDYEAYEQLKYELSGFKVKKMPYQAEIFKNSKEVNIVLNEILENIILSKR
jgi:serine/threonine-protein kinase